MRWRTEHRWGHLPLQLKIMLPYLALVIVVGTAGGALVVHGIAVRAQQGVDRQLAQRLLDVRSAVHDKELYALEAADYAANVSGMAASVTRRDDVTAGKLLTSVLALKTDVAFLVATDTRGVGVAERIRSDGALSSGTGTHWTSQTGVRDLLSRVSGGAHPGAGADILRLSSGDLLVAATPICAGNPCRRIGYAMAGVPLDAVVRAAAVGTAGVSVFAQHGTVSTTTGTPAPTPPRLARDDSLPRVRHGHGRSIAESVYSPLILQDRSVGTLAVTVRLPDVLASATRSVLPVAALLLLAMVGVIVIGGLLSRAILVRLRALLAVSQRLGQGDLNARAVASPSDEIGELSSGFNAMAEQLQAAVATLESRAEQNAEEVARLLQQRTEFFAGMSHEFRTPLAVISAQADLAAGRLEDKHDALHGPLTVVKQAAAEALQVVNDVLRASRAGTSAIEVQATAVELPDVLSELQPILEGLAAGASLGFALIVPPDLPTVWADTRRIRQVVLNLVDNAVKYTPAGGQVTVAVNSGLAAVELSVADSGVGIPLDAQDELFIPFARVPGVTTQSGQASTGLGLALTRQIMEALGGRIGVESAPGLGSTFTVSFPLASTLTAPAQRRNARRATTVST